MDAENLMELLEKNEQDSMEHLDAETALMNIAILYSLQDTGNESSSSHHAALETSVGQARATLPSFCKIRAIEPGGWCFYDSVLAQLPQPLPPEINRFSLATAIIERLAQRRAVLEEKLLHEDDDTVRRRETVLTGQSEDLYLPYMNQLDNFDYYLLSKLEVCCQQRPVLDSCHYADYPEISTFLNVCGLSLMRVKPPEAWKSGNVGSIFAADYTFRNVATMDDARAAASQSRPELLVMHYQFTGFEHYDVLTFDDADNNMSPASAAQTLNFIHTSELAMLMHEGEYNTVRQKLLFMLDKETPSLDPKEESSSEENISENGESEEDDQKSEEDIKDQAGLLPPDVPQLPTGVESLRKVRSGQHPFCASYGQQSHMGNDVSLDIPQLPLGIDGSRKVRSGQRHFCTFFGHQHYNTSVSIAAKQKEKQTGPQWPSNNSDSDKDNESESMSDVSGDSDLYHTAIDADKTWETPEDKDLNLIDYVASLLRARPFLPPDPRDATKDWTDVQSGVAFPRAHCAFRGCSWTSDVPASWEQHLSEHIRREHLAEMHLGEANNAHYMAYYCAGIRVQERKSMPAVGVSIDRRAFKLLADVYNSRSCFTLICAICAQKKTHIGLRSADGKRQLTDIRYTYGLLHNIFQRHKKYFEHTLGLNTYIQRYASDPSSPMTGAIELDDSNWEWRRIMSVGGGIQMPLLCCPEDIELDTSKCKHPEYEICHKCRVPVCSNCEISLWKGRGIPMALGNDNMWGYVTSLIARYKVRWIEMAAILPCWTSMIVYYVEGDIYPPLPPFHPSFIILIKRHNKRKDEERTIILKLKRIQKRTKSIHKTYRFE